MFSKRGCFDRTKYAHGHFFLFFFFNLLILENRREEREINLLFHLFIRSLVDSVCALTRVEPTTLARWHEALTKWTTWPELDVFDGTKSQGPFVMDQISQWPFWTGPNFH